MVNGIGYTDKILNDEEILSIFEKGLANENLSGKSVLFIVPDSTRTFPSNLVFKTIHKLLHGKASKIDYLIALGTHQPMSEEDILSMFKLSKEEKDRDYADVNIYNHEWDNPNALKNLGIITKERISELTGGKFSQDVPIEINKLAYEYDRVIIVGPVFPHEVVGFSGGHKYLFPGIGAAEFINFFHWFAAVITNPKIIGNKYTPVRAIIEEATAMLNFSVSAFCLVGKGHDTAGIYYSDNTYKAWEAASDLSKQIHIIYVDKPYKSILSRSPEMYDDLWTGAKCAYKMESVVEDGGEIVIYAPHITEVSYTHGKVLDEIGYHTRDYFLKQWDKFKHHPWGVVAHSTHLRGIGTYENGVEKPRITVKLATGISKERCEKLALEYVDPKTINIEDWQNTEDRLYVPKAGEMLYKLKDAPDWQKSN